MAAIMKPFPFSTPYGMEIKLCVVGLWVLWLIIGYVHVEPFV